MLYTLFNSVDIVTVLNLVILVGIWWWSQKWKWKSLSRVWLFVTHGLYSPWNSPGQNTGVRSLSLLQGIFPTHESNHGLLIAGGFFTNWAIREAHMVIHHLVLSCISLMVNGLGNLFMYLFAIFYFFLDEISVQICC